jgi:PhnB protein
MPVQAYINFNGNAREAIDFYAEVFGGNKPKVMLFGDMPPNPAFPQTDETKKLVMNATLKIAGSTVMFSDVPPDMPVTIGDNISLIVSSKDMEEVKTLFNKLKVGGTVDMELQETFWSKCYGNLTDKFGIGWQLNFDNGDMEM